MTTLTLRTSFAGLMGAGILLFLSACASDPAPTSPQPIPERRFEISPASAGRVPPQVVEDGSSGPLFVQLRTFDPGGGPVHAAFPEWSHPDGEVYLQVAFEPEPHASSWTPMLAKLRWHTEVNGRALNPHEVFENLPISFYPAGRITWIPVHVSADLKVADGTYVTASVDVTADRYPGMKTAATQIHPTIEAPATITNFTVSRVGDTITCEVTLSASSASDQRVELLFLEASGDGLVDAITARTRYIDVAAGDTTGSRSFAIRSTARFDTVIHVAAVYKGQIVRRRAAY